MAKTNELYREGYQAFILGLSCPECYSDKEKDEWRDGYKHAEIMNRFFVPLTKVKK